MSELHEQYEMLLKLGMPEHPRLACHTDALGDGRHWHLFASHDALARYDNTNAVWVDDADALALITMYALEWYCKGHDGIAFNELFKGRSVPTTIVAAIVAGRLGRMDVGREGEG